MAAGDAESLKTRVERLRELKVKYQQGLAKINAALRSIDENPGVMDVLEALDLLYPRY